MTSQSNKHDAEWLRARTRKNSEAKGSVLKVNTYQKGRAERGEKGGDVKTKLLEEKDEAK